MTIQGNRLTTRVYFSVEQMLPDEGGHPIGFYVVLLATGGPLDMVSAFVLISYVYCQLNVKISNLHYCSCRMTPL